MKTMPQHWYSTWVGLSTLGRRSKVTKIVLDYDKLAEADSDAEKEERIERIQKKLTRKMKQELRREKERRRWQPDDE